MSELSAGEIKRNPRLVLMIHKVGFRYHIQGVNSKGGGGGGDWLASRYGHDWSNVNCYGLRGGVRGVQEVAISITMWRMDRYGHISHSGERGWHHNPLTGVYRTTSPLP